MQACVGDFYICGLIFQQTLLDVCVPVFMDEETEFQGGQEICWRQHGSERAWTWIRVCLVPNSLLFS